MLEDMTEPLQRNTETCLTDTLSKTKVFPKTNLSSKASLNLVLHTEDH